MAAEDATALPEESLTSSPAGKSDLEAIRARVDGTTDGPWMSASDNGRKTGIALVGAVADRGTGHAIAVLASTNGRGHADAEFIANARTDVPALLDLVASLQAEVAAERAKTAGGEWKIQARPTHGVWVDVTQATIERTIREDLFDCEWRRTWIGPARPLGPEEQPTNA